MAHGQVVSGCLNLVQVQDFVMLRLSIHIKIIRVTLTWDINLQVEIRNQEKLLI